MVSKREEIQLLIADNQPQFVALTETWLTEDIQDTEVTIDGYNMRRADRIGSGYGGVLLYVKEEIQLAVMETHQSLDNKCEMLICTAKLPSGQAYTIAVIYRSPNNTDPRWMHTLRKYSQRPGFIITGDFNFPHINWETYSWSGPTNSQEFMFLQWVEENQLIQHVSTHA